MGGCFAYDLEMNWWPTKRGEAKVPVIPDRRPYLNDGFMGLMLPVAERHHSAENAHRLFLVRPWECFDQSSARVQIVARWTESLNRSTRRELLLGPARRLHFEIYPNRQLAQK